MKAISKLSIPPNKYDELYDVNVNYLLTGNTNEENQNDSYDLEELLKNKKLTWGDEELNEEERKRAIEILKILLDKHKDTT